MRPAAERNTERAEDAEMVSSADSGGSASALASNEVKPL